MKPILILKTGRTIDSIPQEQGDFEDWIIAGMELPAENFQTVRVYLDEPLPEPSSVNAIIITGSPAMVTDDLAWIGRSAGFIREAISGGVPVLGICFGHQLIAFALGGRVDFHPLGREIGTTGIELTAKAGSDPLFQGLPLAFPAHVSHMQSVLEIPGGAEILATNEFDGCHGVRFGNQAWGVQFHPEFDETIMKQYIRGREDQIREEGLDPELLLSRVAATPAARTILKNFAVLCRQ